MKLLVNPRKGWANAPDIEVYDFEFPEYDKTEGLIWECQGTCYFTQQPSGYTDFLFHDPFQLGIELIHCDDKISLVSHNNGGYGGAKFPIKLRINGKIIDYTLVGPWSGGCYNANEFLPRKCYEVYMMDRKYRGRAYMPIDMLNEQFNKQDSKWRVVDGFIGTWHGQKSYWVEPFFDGVRKELMDEATKNALHDVWEDGKCL